MKTRKNLFKPLRVAVILALIACVAVMFGISAGAAVTEPSAADEVIWDLEVNVSANVTVTDNSENCKSNYDHLPTVFAVSNDCLSYYMNSGTNTAENPGTVNVSVFGNESVSFTAEKTYSVYFDFLTNGYDGLENAKLTLVLADAESGEIKKTIGEVDINKSTDTETVTEIVSFTPEVDVTNCKVGFTLTGSLVSNYYLLKVYDLTVVQAHVHNYNEYVYVSEEQCALVCDCGADAPDSEPIAHSFVDGVCENCQSAQSYLLKNGDTEKKFISWNALINYANENVAKTDTGEVTLLCDAVSDGNTWIDRNLDIDLAGHKLSNFTASVSTNSGTVQVRFTDSSEDKTGEILQRGAVYCFTSYDNATIIIDGIRTDGGFCVNYGGSVIINDIVPTTDYTDCGIIDGSITVNGGDYGHFVLQMNSDKASVSVKDITCTTYEVRDNGDPEPFGFTIGDTLADGYTLVDADGNLLNVNRTRIDGNISTQEHTHAYTSLFYNDTEHWTACACGVMEDGAVTEAHKGGVATCTAQATCEVCDQSYGTLADHTEGTAASCTAQATCSVCGQSYGEMLAHTEGIAATCTEQAVCSVCGQGYGEPAGHSGGTVSCTEYAKCEKCGNEYGELLPHTGGTATCTTQAVCAFCENPYGDLAPHTEGTPATCKSLAICSVCEQPYGDYAAHTGGNATCIALAVCEVCDQPYGNLAAHTWGDSSCTVCGAPYPIVVTVEGETASFTSLEEAFNAIKQSGIENAEIKLVDDIIGQGYISVYSGNIVFDLNGYTVSGCELEVYEANITMKDTSEDGSGAFSGSFYLLGFSNLTVESGNIDGLIYLYPQYGLPSVVINGGKFSKNFYVMSYGGGININGGEFTYGYFIIGDVNTNCETMLGIVGGKFEGGIYVDSESGEMILSDILPEGSCTKYLDADGNEISVDKSSVVYYGYVEITHAGEYETNNDDYCHWNECTECGAVVGYSVHSGGEATCTDYAECEVCGTEYGSLLAHTGGEATCTAKAVCEMCGTEYGSMLPHDYSDGDVCVNCDAGLPIKVIVGEEEFLFDDMAEAIIKASEYESAKIVLQENAIYNEEIYAYVYGDVELDLAGYTIYNVEFSVYGSLTVNDSSEEQSGTISGNYAFRVYGGSLTINGGNIDASLYMNGQEGYNSVITINGGRFTGQYGVDVYDYSELYINGGVFDCDEEEIYLSVADPSTVTVILSGGEFPNGLEVVGGNVYDVLTDVDCLTYIDEDGYAIAPDELDTYYYKGYIAVGHDREEWLDLCKDEEKHWYECSNCDYVSKAVGHGFGDWESSDDENHERACLECGHTETEAHGFGEYTSNGDGSCTKQGTKSAVCGTCGETDTISDETTGLGHSLGDWTKVDGETHKRSCDCGHEETDEHEYSEWVVRTEPTETEKGMKTRTCGLCGYVEKKSIPVKSSETEPNDGNETDPNDGSETEPNDGSETEPNGGNETETDGGSETESYVETEGGETPTEPETDKQDGSTETEAPEKSGGCGSSLGFGSIAIISTVALAGFMLKKKKD